jgi:hypothetical protein
MNEFELYQFSYILINQDILDNGGILATFSPNCLQSLFHSGCIMNSTNLINSMRSMENKVLALGAILLISAILPLLLPIRYDTFKFNYLTFKFNTIYRLIKQIH